MAQGEPINLLSLSCRLYYEVPYATRLNNCEDTSHEDALSDSLTVFISRPPKQGPGTYTQHVREERRRGLDN